MDRPITTLFMLMSVDGKISPGVTDNLDFDKDFPDILGLKEGLHQYYDIEQTTDLWSLNSGRVQEKIGVNKRELPDKTSVSFVIIDNCRLQLNTLTIRIRAVDQFIIISSVGADSEIHLFPSN